MEKQFQVAIMKDLGRTEYITKIFELDGVVGHCDHHLANIDEYVKDD
jgi:hypothetical protein